MHKIVTYIHKRQRVFYYRRMEFDRAGFDREVGLRLQRARKERGITQEELAKRIGLPRPSYANIESGRQRIPVDVVWRAAIVLGLPIAWFMPEPLSRRGSAALMLPVEPSAIPTLPAITNTTTSGAAQAPPTESRTFQPWGKAPDGLER
jgi:transcriptional regulator with XRE-family HTH domain